MFCMQIARMCVEASKRVVAGYAPFDNFNQEDQSIYEALNRTNVITIPQAKKGQSKNIVNDIIIFV